MKKFIFFCVLAFSNFLLAAADPTCTPVNLTAKKKIFNGIPTYDQAGGQTCFAYTAAQLIEGQRVLGGHTYDKNKAINPLSIALSYAIKNDQSDIQQGGVACQAVNHARTTPTCPASKSFKTAEEIEGHIANFKECQLNPTAEKCKKLAAACKCDITKLYAGSPLLYVKAVEDTKCSEKDKIVLDIPECNYTNDESKPNSFFQKSVDDIFDAKSPRPVEIGYSMHLLSYSGIEKKNYKIDRVVEPDGVMFSLRYKPHSSVLLGRRMGKNGQCQYLLRNTQGKSFCPSGIVSQMGWECDSKSEGIWINSTELFESTFQVSSIAEKAPIQKSLRDFLNLNKISPPMMCTPFGFLDEKRTVH